MTTLVIPPREGKAVSLGGFGVIYKISGDSSEGRFQSSSTRSIPAEGRHFDASTLPLLVSMWMIQKAAASSWLIIATTPVPAEKK
jgi:hypothetical protein